MGGVAGDADALVDKWSKLRQYVASYRATA